MKFDKYLKEKNKYNLNYDDFKKNKKIDFDSKINLIKKQNNEKYYFKRNLIALCSCLIIFIFVSIIIINQNFPTKSKSEGPSFTPGGVIVNPGDYAQKENSSSLLQANLRANAILGIASFKEFEEDRLLNVRSLRRSLSNNNIITNNEENNKDNTIYNVTYPYDYIKIHSAVKFSLEIPEEHYDEGLELIQKNCGLGLLEITIADFSTYISEDNGSYQECVTDLMISFKGKKGIYTILSNSGISGDDQSAFEDKHYYTVFSSHKKINSQEISKDFELPIYCVLLDESEGEIELTFSKGDLMSPHDFASKKNSLFHYQIDMTTLKKVSKDTLYNIQELSKFPETKQIVEIKEIDNKESKIYVNSELGLECIYIDELTELNNEVVDDIYINLYVGMKIEVYYDYWYQGYTPSIIYANNIKTILE